jgi:sulfur-oxidizing protein SoxY
MGLVTIARATEAVAWPKEAFDQKTEDAAVKLFYKGRPIEPSDKVTFTAPEIAENGAVVPVSVTSTLPEVTSIAFMVPENPFTLTAAYVIPDGTLPEVACRLKMAKTAKVIAVVESGGKLYSAERMVKVTLGGCG